MPASHKIKAVSIHPDNWLAPLGCGAAYTQAIQADFR